MTQSSQIQITASSHFPTKLLTNNFHVWRRQVQSTFIGLGLEDYITWVTDPTTKFIIDKDKSKPNHEYTTCYRQDHVVFDAILGSCSDAIHSTYHYLCIYHKRSMKASQHKLCQHLLLKNHLFKIQTC